MRESWLRDELQRHYAKMLGELAWLDAPPKRLTRLLPDRQRFEAERPVRDARRAAIIEALPHLAYVIRMFAPDWDETSVKPIRPRAAKSGLPPQGISGAAIDILREAEQPLSIAEIVVRIADKHDLEVDSVGQRQKYHTAVNNALKSTFRDVIAKVDGYPERWFLT